MADVVLFHHLLGLTDGVLGLAERLRAGRHTVHTPDLFAGERPAILEAGLELTGRIGDDELAARAERALDGLPAGLVYAGVSFGVRDGAAVRADPGRRRGALLYEACLPISGEWAIGPWPDGVPAQVHGMEKDPFFGLEGDVDAARELVAAVRRAVRLSRRPAPVHRQLAADLRRRRDRPGDRPLPGVPAASRPRLTPGQRHHPGHSSAAPLRNAFIMQRRDEWPPHRQQPQSG